MMISLKQISLGKRLCYRELEKHELFNLKTSMINDADLDT